MQVDPAVKRPETASIANLKAEMTKISAEPPVSRDGCKHTRGVCQKSHTKHQQLQIACELTLSGLIPIPPVTETVEKSSISPLDAEQQHDSAGCGGRGCPVVAGGSTDERALARVEPAVLAERSRLRGVQRGAAA